MVLKDFINRLGSPQIVSHKFKTSEENHQPGHDGQTTFSSEPSLWFDGSYTDQKLLTMEDFQLEEFRPIEKWPDDTQKQELLKAPGEQQTLNSIRTLLSDLSLNAPGERQAPTVNGSTRGSTVYHHTDPIRGGETCESFSSNWSLNHRSNCSGSRNSCDITADDMAQGTLQESTAGLVSPQPSLGPSPAENERGSSQTRHLVTQSSGPPSPLVSSKIWGFVEKLKEQTGLEKAQFYRVRRSHFDLTKSGSVHRTLLAVHEVKFTSRGCGFTVTTREKPNKPIAVEFCQIYKLNDAKIKLRDYFNNEPEKRDMCIVKLTKFMEFLYSDQEVPTEFLLTTTKPTSQSPTSNSPKPCTSQDSSNQPLSSTPKSNKDNSSDDEDDQDDVTTGSKRKSYSSSPKRKISADSASSGSSSGSGCSTASQGRKSKHILEIVSGLKERHRLERMETDALRAYYVSIKSADPSRPNEHVRDPICHNDRLLGHPKKTLAPKSKFEGCPHSGEGATSEQNSIDEVNSYSTRGTRLLFRVRFAENQQHSWVDFKTLLDLEPDHIWRDFIRGIYLYNPQRRKALLATARTSNLEDRLKDVLDFPTLESTCDAIRREQDRIKNAKANAKRLERSGDKKRPQPPTMTQRLE